jgi:CheY-like chemotaxis protein
MPHTLAPTRPLCVLVVDDYPDTVDTVAVLLSADGHDVRTARSGADALALLDAWQPDVAVLDLLLPGSLDGFALAEKLCELSRRRPLLVAVTGSIRKEDRNRAVAAGFDHHFLKPVDPCELADLLRLHATSRNGS